MGSEKERKQECAMMSQRIRRQAGFTLMEVLLVMVILVVLASFAFVALGPIQRQTKLKQAKGQIGMFESPLGMYNMDIGTYPTTAQGLDALRSAPGDLANSTKWAGPYLNKDIPLDPWDRPYQYASPGAHNPDSFDVWTVSPYDGQEIGNWIQR
jgi:general secretion pathway protein G